ncbi:MAG: hypothetical protein LBU42_09070, partial [Prevotellaceae bacterium]|nr:hypothetical protein [Prevotellaceae bacterium]
MAGLNDIIFQKQTGGMGRPAANEDPISGLMMSLNGKATSAVFPAFDPVTAGDVTLYLAKVSYYEQLQGTFGITPVADPAGSADYAKNAIDYHVKEFFRLSPSGTLYLAVKLTGEVTGDEVKVLQNYAGGAIRQAGIFTGGVTKLADYQTAATALEAAHKPLSI